MAGFPRFDPRPGDEPVCPRLTRFRVDLARGRTTDEPLAEHRAEFGAIRPDRMTRRHRHVWATAAAPERPEPFFTGLLKVDCETRQARFRDFAPHLTGEPVFVARPGGIGEDDGWLLSMHYVDEERTCHLLVLDARDLSTVCRLRMPHPTPLGFHGTFVPATA
jgi:all-trans-8'-apo-beta-carotenal 15,15'-oxygenase